MKVFLALSFLSIVSGEYLEGYHLDVPLLKSLKDVGLRSCCKECSAYTNCQSVNYNKNDFSCELNYHHLSGLSGKTALNESVYMDRDHCFTLASCSANFCNLTCKINEKCVLTSTHQPTCIISECDPVDIIPDIIPINMSRLVGIRHSLRCSTQPYPSRQRVRCDTDGQWIRQYDTCKCFSGTFWGGGSTCIECPAGQHLPYDDVAGNASCIDCPAGSYTPGPGYADCLACRPGYYAPKTESSFCKECPAGSYTPSPGYDHCMECPAGYFSWFPGSNSCTACPVGSHTPGSGYRYCILCPAGFFSPVPGSDSCIECPAGYCSPDPGYDSCIECPAGYYTPEPRCNSSCTACPPGSYQSEAGQT
uniref:Tyrosine-protein kinase ephrin type A/B receptor-like domain-containing protein n=2 Tax=Magallana gigas TaxID=29159 RepID=A0A8W8MUP8_MAGGI